ncbi:unnamed protein product, partial [Rotaria sp. Silwood2]
MSSKPQTTPRYSNERGLHADHGWLRSYIVDGELQHKNSLDNTKIIHCGEIQFTSVGTDIHLSEHNVNKSLWVHFIQIWAKS